MGIFPVSGDHTPFSLCIATKELFTVDILDYQLIRNILVLGRDFNYYFHVYNYINQQCPRVECLQFVRRSMHICVNSWGADGSNSFLDHLCYSQDFPKSRQVA